ncbi:MAG: hypothetical protein MZV64_73030 [Ignavibacteriales bacterium]|nr:hypothetical protein [Ignavibacteriales bacterium]
MCPARPDGRRAEGRRDPGRHAGPAHGNPRPGTRRAVCSTCAFEVRRDGRPRGRPGRRDRGPASG